MTTRPEPTRPRRPLRTALLVLAVAAVVAGLLWGTSLLPRETQGTTRGTTQDTGGETSGGTSPDGIDAGTEGPDDGTDGADGADEADPGSPMGICAVALVFEGRTYFGEPAGDVRPGRALGTGTVPACNDTPGSVDDTDPGTAEVRAVPGESPEEVVLVGDMLFRATPAGG